MFLSATRRTVLGVALLLNVVICGRVSAAAVPDQKTPPSRVAIVTPFTPLPHHGAPIIRIRLNGEVVGRFMIDTGASYSVMTRAMAKRLGLKGTLAYSHGGGLYMGSDGGRQSEYVNVASLIIGEVQLTGTQFILVDDSDFFRFGDEKVDGLIGNQLLENTALLINYPRRTLTLYLPGGLSDDEIRALRMNNAARVRLKPEIVGAYNYHQFSTELTLTNGDRRVKEKVYIDTGAPSTSIGQSAAEHLGLSAVACRSASTMGDGSVFGNVGEAPSMQIGDLNLTNFAVEYPGKNANQRIPPLLGEDVLGYCVCLWDFPKNTLFLRPTLPPIAVRPANAPATPPDRIDPSRLRAAAAELPPVVYAAPEPDSPDAEGMEGDETPSDRREARLAAMKNDPSDAQRWDEIGDLYREAKDRTKAKEAYKKSVALYRRRIEASPQDVPTRCEFVLALCDADLDDEAETVARRLTVEAPKDAMVWTTLGRVLQRRALRSLTGMNRTVDVTTHDLSEFRVLIARLLDNKPTDAQVAKTEALSREARECYDRAVSLAPNDYRVYEKRAGFRAEEGLGIDATRRALKGEDADVFAALYAADCVHDWETAADLAPGNIRLQQTAAAFAAQSPLLRNERGLDFRAGKFWASLPAGARKSVQKRLDRLEALSHNPNTTIAGKALEALGVLQYHALQDNDLAEKTLRHALETDPRRLEAAEALTELLMEERRYEDVVTVLGVEAAKSDCAVLHLWLAQALVRLDRWDNAQTHLDAALKQSPDSLQVNLLNAFSLLQRSDEDTTARLTHAKDAWIVSKRSWVPTRRTLSGSGNFFMPARSIWLFPGSPTRPVMSRCNRSRTNARTRRPVKSSPPSRHSLSRR